jgi:hypothetical protein
MTVNRKFVQQGDDQMVLKVLLGMNKGNKKVGDELEVADTSASGMIVAVGTITELLIEGGIIYAMVKVIAGF